MAKLVIEDSGFMISSDNDELNECLLGGVELQAVVSAEYADIAPDTVDGGGKQICVAISAEEVRPTNGGDRISMIIYGRENVKALHAYLGVILEQYPDIPPKLEYVADTCIPAQLGYISTQEFATAIRKSVQTIRKNHHLSGACFGIKPKKIGNRLYWPEGEVYELIRKGEIKA